MIPRRPASGLDQVELDINRALWESHNITDYDFVLGRGCSANLLTVCRAWYRFAWATLSLLSRWQAASRTI
jgi:hypothetical protein